ncbi:MAG: DUF4012 domain-containing protein [Patescibacteria group bacterium]
MKEKLLVIRSKLLRVLKNKFFWLLIAILILIPTTIGLAIGLPALAFAKQAKGLETNVQGLKEALAKKDFALIKDELNKTAQAIDQLDVSYRRIALARIIPVAKNYYSDGQRVMTAAQSGIKTGQILIEAIEPYQDFLGFTGGQAQQEEVKSSEQTTEGRINFLVDGVESIKPKLDEIDQQISIVNDNIGQIDASRYPEEFRGYQIKSQILKTQNLIGEAGTFFKEGRPLIEKLDWLLGKDSPRQYLFLFQNDAELRATGGFWTAYGVLKVDKGKIAPLLSEDIYSLDARFNSALTPPRPIKEYHKGVYYWYLRDMNLSPDFQVSVEEFLTHYDSIPKMPKFDGVIAIDTQVLVDILKVLGRVGVPGWGNFEADADDRCWGCPQVVYQLEMLADKPTNVLRTERKGFLAPLMHSVLANAFGSPKEKVAALAEVAFTDLTSKHILVYFQDPELQKAAESLNIAGKIRSFDGDYFHLSDTNFAGAKSNLFIEQEVKQEYRKESGKIIKKVSVTYKNTAPASNCNLEKGDLCLNGLYRNWFRFYVPEGSQLIKMTGSEVEPVVYKELGKTVLEGFYGDKYPLYPNSTSKVTVEYQLPNKYDTLLIQKQPGTKNNLYEIWVEGQKQESLELKGDTVVGLGW